MDILKKCQNLYQELRNLDEALAFVQEKLNKSDITLEETEHFLKEEFRISLDMSCIFEDLNLALNKLEQEEDMKFLSERMRKNASQIFIVEEINGTSTELK